jgi:hypothetical protein
MKSFIRVVDQFIRLSLFALAFGLVVIFLLAIDEFVVKQRLFFLRTGDWDNLITVTVFGILIAYVLKKLLLLQYHWGVKR